MKIDQTQKAIIARLRKAVKTNLRLAEVAAESGSVGAREYANGSAFGFAQAIRIIRELSPK